MSFTGPADGSPYRLGVAVADIVSGCSRPTVSCWRSTRRQTTDRGQQVDVAMLDSVAALLTYQAGIVFATGEAPGRMGNRHPSIAPYDTYDAKTAPVGWPSGNDEQWQRFCRVAGLDARRATRDSRRTRAACDTVTS